MFLNKKEVINQTIAQKKKELEKLHSQLQTVTIGQGAVEERLEEICSWHNIKKLDRNIIDLLINKIKVYDKNEIEIVWNDRD